MNPNVVACFALISRLKAHGVEHAVISPGSRSTALAYAADKILKTNVVIDERDAGFLALGIAESSMAPVVIITTSGSAPAHLYPAVVEANQSNIGLILLTADRPHEVRGRGAPQTIDQVNLYSNSVRRFIDSECPHDNNEEVYWESLADQIFEKANMASVESGPVHLNLGMREPLVPDGDEILPAISPQPFAGVTPAKEKMVDLSKFVGDSEKVLITLGRFFDGDVEAVLEFATKLNAPVLADILSNARTNEKVISNYDAIARTQDKELFPEVIIQFGDPLTSKVFNLNYGEKAKVLRVTKKNDNRNPYGHQDLDVFIKSYDDFFDLLFKNITNSEFVNKWMQASKEANNIVVELMNDYSDSEPAIMSNIGAGLSKLSAASILLGSSMPVRYGEWLWQTQNRNSKIYSHRGTNGIDGMISSSIGIAIGANNATVAVIGDVTFAHDIGFLPHAQRIASSRNLSLTLIVIDNGGGKIFSHLDQAKSASLNDSYDSLFNTDPKINIKAFAEASNVNYVETNIETIQVDIENNVKKSGVNMIHIKCGQESGTAFMSALNEALS